MDIDLDLDPPKWVSWTPRGIEHVQGRYTERRMNEHGMPMPQSFEVMCTKCGAKWGGPCMSGQVRLHIQQFAMKHLHRDPLLEAPRIERPGNHRRTRADYGDD